MAFTASGIPYENDLYTLVRREDGSGWASNWPPKAKELLQQGLCPFPNLPYLTVTRHQAESSAEPVRQCVVQSGAILRLVGRLGGLVGEDTWEQSQVDELLEQTMDMRNELTSYAYSSNPETFAASRESFCGENLSYYLGGFEKWLLLRKDSGSHALVGGGLTIADLAVFDVVEVAAELMRPFINVSTQYQLLANHSQWIRSLPQLQSYFQSTLSSLPFNNKVAVWGAEAGMPNKSSLEDHRGGSSL